MGVENRDLARRWYQEVWNERRDEAIEEMFSPEGIGHTETGEMVGIEPFKQIRAQFLGAFPDLQFRVEDTLAEGDDVVIRWTALGTHTGDTLGVAPCGRPIEVHGMTWHRYKDGLMVEGWDSWNLGALMQHIQEPPTPGASDEAALARRQGIAARIRRVREELFGPNGGPELAGRLGLPPRTWYNYETGVTVPAEVLLAFLEQTGAEPRWILSGEGPTYRTDSGKPPTDG